MSLKDYIEKVERMNLLEIRDEIWRIAMRLFGLLLIFIGLNRLLYPFYFVQKQVDGHTTRYEKYTQEWQALRTERCIVEVARILGASPQKFWTRETTRRIIENVCH